MTAQIAEGSGYRSIVVGSQSVSWLASHAVKLRFTLELHRPAGLFEHGSERCLILAPMHPSIVDPWLIMGALRYRHWRALIPVRTLATQSFRGPLRWFLPLIRILYRAEGVIELPPKEEGGTLPEKVQGLLHALQQGDVVAIFPEGGIRKQRHPPVGEFAPGVVYLQRRSGARIVPIAVWMSERRWPRRRCIIEVGEPVRIPESMTLDEGAAWLRERTRALYERASRRTGETA